MIVAGHSQSKITRLTALVLAVVALCLSSFGTLKHTDDLSAIAQVVSTSVRVAAQVSHPYAQPDNDECAACQWAQIAPDLTTPTVSVHAELLDYVQPRQERAVHVAGRTLTRATLRAPPFAA